MSLPRYTANAMTWLEDYQHCLEGDEGVEWADRADEFVQQDLPTDGTSWTLWRDLRWADR